MGSCCSPSGADLASLGQTAAAGDAGVRTTPSDITLRRQPPGEFADIPAGTFTMGDHHNEGYPQDGETPAHQVHLAGFRMQTTTVTNAQFEEFVEATGYRTTAEQFGVSAVF